MSTPYRPEDRYAVYVEGLIHEDAQTLVRILRHRGYVTAASIQCDPGCRLEMVPVDTR